MRARLPLTASITFVLGLELSTGFMEYALRQYSNGIETFLNPNLQLGISSFRFFFRKLAL